MRMTQSCDLSKLKLVLALSSTLVTTFANRSLAQNITLDGTLGPAQTLNGPVYTIPQPVGQTVGNNLFHSFGSFSLFTGERANFQSAADIRNIFSRVTGGSPSLINGLIFTNSPNVNLFLINPSGIVFGPNARLDVGGSTRGSFVATTADALVWSNGSQFSATNPGGASNLLTIVGDPSGFLFNSRPSQPLQAFNSQFGVYAGQSLLLLGGNVSFDNSNLFVDSTEGGRLDNSNLFVDATEGGRIEIGAVAEPGTVALNTNGNILSLNFPENVALANVTLTNGSILDARAANAGNIAINARNINLLAGSQLLAGIGRGLGNNNSQAGNITLNASAITRIDQGSRIANNVNSDATGNAGNINITTDSLFVTNNAELSASTFGQGNAGSLNINAGDVLFNGGDAFSRVAEGAVGNGGDISITTDLLSLRNDAALTASTFGQGNAGRVTIDAGSVLFNDSNAFTTVGQDAVGNGGDISISANFLSVTNGAQLIASTLTGGEGNAGNVILNAQQIRFDGMSSNAFSDVEQGAIGNAGDIRINADSLFVNNGAQLVTSSNGRGNAGNVIIDAGDVFFNGGDAFSRIRQQGVGDGGNISITSNFLSVSNGSQLQASTLGQGNAGSVTIDAQDVSFNDGDAFTTVGENAVGDAGNINITSNFLSVTNGSQLVTSSSGQGNAGNVIIDAGDVFFNDGDAFSRIRQQGVGDSGDISITSNFLSVSNGSQLQASTLGQGNAGSVIIDAQNVLFNGGDALSRVEEGAVGNGGNININTDLLALTNNARLSVSTFEQGNAGSVIIDARYVLFNDSDAFSTVENGAVGNGGNISINTDLLSLRNDAALTASTFGQGNAGSVTINAGSVLFNDSNAFTTVRENAVGDAGNINITANFLSITNGSELQALTRGQGNAGSVTINAGSILFNDSNAFTTVGQDAVGNGGDINITSNFLSVTNGSQLQALTRGQGNAGSVNINAQDVSFNGGDAFSRVEEGAVGNGGNISITTDSLSLTNDAALTASTFGQGNAGSVTINAQNVSFDGGDAFTTVGETGIGNGGDISITTDSLFVTNGAQLQALTRGQGNAGNVQITAFDQFSVSGTDSRSGRSSALFTITGTDSTGEGGDINVNTQFFNLSNGAVLDARTNNDKIGGNITVNARIFELFNGGQLITTTSSRGNAGKITVNATEKVTINGTDATFNDRVAQFGTRVANFDAASGLFVRSESLGSAGDIEVNSPLVVLNNQARFIAESASVNGGDITLNIADLLLLRRGSQISATAGIDQTDGNGGNIRINAGFLVGVPNEVSKITANAFSGTGGQIQINTQGLFGIEPRPTTNTSSISASSTTGISGEIIINTPNVDPSQGLTNLPTNTVDAAGLIDSACSALDNQTSGGFNITGRGGLPSSPDDNLSGDVVWSDTRLTAVKPQNGSLNRAAKPLKTNDVVSIVPATGWVFGKKGEVTLITQAPQTDSHRVNYNHAQCHTP